MKVRRDELLDELERHYRDSGWPVERADDGTVRATGPGGVSWIGMVVVAADLASEAFETRILDLSERRMPGGGELCPFEMLPAQDCADQLRAVLDRLRLRERVSVYSLAA